MDGFLFLPFVDGQGSLRRSHVGDGAEERLFQELLLQPENRLFRERIEEHMCANTIARRENDGVCASAKIALRALFREEFESRIW